MSKTASLRLNRPQVASQVIDGEAVIIHFETGSYYSTGGVGSVIVDLVTRHASHDEIVAQIVRRSGAARDEVDSAIAQFLEELKDEQLVAEVDAGAAEDDAAEDAIVSDGTLEFAPPCLHKYTDLQDLLLIDPIHDTDESGWPAAPKPRDGGGD